MDVGLSASSINQSVVSLASVDWQRHVEHLLMFFYIVPPSRTMFEHSEEAPNYFMRSVIYLPIFFAIEGALMWVLQRRTYKWSDSLVAVCSFIMILFPMLVMESFEVNLFTWLHENFHIVRLPWNSMWTWFFCILATDFSIYWTHRLNHEISFLWAFHEPHHTSEYFNLFAGLRLSVFNRYVVAMFDMPWALLFPPSVFYVHHQINYIYQFWIHTETIPSLGVLEYVFNTPALHRIHHGRNRHCIDKNYASVFSIWDQLFGTIEWPRDNDLINYGLVHTIKSWDIFHNQFHYFGVIRQRLQETQPIGDKVSVVLKGPGWEPGKPRLGDVTDIPETYDEPEPYNKTSSTFVCVYATCIVAFVFTYFFTVARVHQILPFYVRALIVIYLVWSVGNVGHLLEHRWFSPVSEWTRCVSFFLLEAILVSVTGPLGVAFDILRCSCVIGLVIWTFNLTMYSNKDTTTKIE